MYFVFLLFRDQDWDFLPFRVWVGFWTGFFILLIVVFDLSALVRYITRFTEESFACLIALIFIYEAFKKTFEIEKYSPVQFNPQLHDAGCFCVIENSTMKHSTTPQFNVNASISNLTASLSNITTSIPIVPNIATTTANWLEKECLQIGGHIASGCEDKYVPDVFFFSLMLFIGTFCLATVLVHFRHSLFFPTFVSLSFVSLLTLCLICVYAT